MTVDSWIPPRYGRASLAEVLPGALRALGVPGAEDPLDLAGALPGVRRILVLLVDGLGMAQLPAVVAAAPGLAELIAARGTVRELTSAFPSTTPTSLATLSTGAAPGAHGVLGFTVVIPGGREKLVHIDWTTGPDPWSWQPLPTGYQRAGRAGIRTVAVGRPEFAAGRLNTALYRGARFVGATGPAALAGTLLAELAGAAPCLVYGYHGELDAAGHQYGLDSARWAAAAGTVADLLTRLVAGLPADAALLVTGDHGQLDVPVADRLDVAERPDLAAGVALIAGEPRVRYLYPVPGARDDVLAAWRAGLADSAWVATRDEAIGTGWYGPVPAAHAARIGEIVVVCRGTRAVLAGGHEPRSVAALVAMHGSLTPAEMLVPLLVLR